METTLLKYHDRRHPRDAGAAEAEEFPAHLAVEAKVGVS
jgi:hypothetical protein